MGVTVNGSHISITNADIEVVNANNDESGVAYIIITPEGGVGSLPFLSTGAPGQPALFPIINLVEVDPLDPLPSPNPLSVLIDAGGSGLPSRYALTFYVHKGDTGADGAASIAGASDLSASPVLGAGTEKYLLAYRNSDSKFVPTAQRVGDLYVSSTIAATAYDNTSARLLSTISIPAQPFDWRPLPFASCPVTGSSDTRVDLVCRLNNASSGDQVGYSKGQAGATPPPNILIPAPPANSSVPGSYGLVAAGATATIHLRAEQKAASSNAWSTPASDDTTFNVVIQALL